MTSRSKAVGHALEVRVVQEAHALGLSAQVQPGSGVYKDYPHDAVIEGMLVECKVRAVDMDAGRATRIFRFDLNWLKQVVSAALGKYRMGVVVFRPRGSQEKYVVIALSDFLALLARSPDAGK